ncbi:deaminase [Rhodopseudomonas sp. BR0M22]|uniref:deaminase n=1 Tax=Rhodopseudomonas sp. BR0M22 TaxID=2269369 RepID=UPI0013DF00D9|nr:deaminase [Rhodopseudomonas sp. BR0M22]NEW92520.1 CMP deaminase [Rhodopseudomonas sp. BR0M22]
MAISQRDQKFLLRCEEIRQQSHDPDRSVGVVIVDAEGQVVAEGTNAPPTVLGLTRDQSHEAIRQNPDWKYFVLEHAERNAIFSALTHGKSLRGATMYGTLFPCADCARAIAAAGISRLIVVGSSLDPSRDEKWLNHYRHAEHILAMAGIKISVFDPTNAASRMLNN